MIKCTEKGFSLRPLLTTAAHSIVSFPWITALIWSECSPLSAKVSSVCRPTVCTTPHAPITAWHTGEEDSPSGPVLASEDAAGFSARSSHECAVSALRHWEAMKSRADSGPTGPRQRIKTGQQCDGQFLGGKQLWCWTSSTVLGLSTSSEWAGGWWTRWGRWGGRASVSL